MGPVVCGNSSLHGESAPNQSGKAHLNLRGREIFAEHFAHDAVEPAQMPGRLVPFQAGNSSHSHSKSFRNVRLVLLHKVW